MVFLMACFEILPDRTREFEQSIAWLVSPGSSSSEQGRDRGLYRKWGGDGAGFLYMAALVNLEEVKRHLESEPFRTLMGAINVLGTLTYLKVATQEDIEQMGISEVLD